MPGRDDRIGAGAQAIELCHTPELLHTPGATPFPCDPMSYATPHELSNTPRTTWWATPHPPKSYATPHFKLKSVQHLLPGPCPLQCRIPMGRRGWAVGCPRLECSSAFFVPLVSLAPRRTSVYNSWFDRLSVGGPPPTSRGAGRTLTNDFYVCLCSCVCVCVCGMWPSACPPCTWQSDRCTWHCLPGLYYQGLMLPSRGNPRAGRRGGSPGASGAQPGNTHSIVQIMEISKAVSNHCFRGQGWGRGALKAEKGLKKITWESQCFGRLHCKNG